MRDIKLSPSVPVETKVKPLSYFCEESLVELCLSPLESLSTDKDYPIPQNPHYYIKHVGQMLPIKLLGNISKKILDKMKTKAILISYLERLQDKATMIPDNLIMKLSLMLQGLKITSEDFMDVFGGRVDEIKHCLMLNFLELISSMMSELCLVQDCGRTNSLKCNCLIKAGRLTSALDPLINYSDFNPPPPSCLQPRTPPLP